jgi:hypothetical protein
VSQRFASPQAACEAFEHNQVQWTLDLYLRHMGDEMTLQRGADDYKPTAMKEEEARGGPRRVQPWQGSSTPPPQCALSARPAPRSPSASASLAASRSELPHLQRRRRSGTGIGAAVGVGGDPGAETEGRS